MEKVREFLLEQLKKVGIEKEFITSMDMTTEELGLGSIELVNLSVAVIDEFGVNLKLKKKDNRTLESICTEIVEEMESRVK